MLKNYFKIAIKVLMRRKFFTFVSLFGISFTLAFILIAVSFLDNTFGAKSPETKLDRTLSATFMRLERADGGSSTGPLFSYYFLNKYVRTLKNPEKISLSSFHTGVIIYKNGKRFDVAMKFCDGQFWNILDFKFLEGKKFSVSDVDNKNPVAVINKELKEKYFDGESAVGKTIESAGKTYTVVGVVENVSLLRLLPYADIWVPISLREIDITKPCTISDFPAYFAMVLAKNKSDIPKIQAEYQSKIKNIQLDEKEFKTLYSNIDTYAEAISRNLNHSSKGNVTPMIFIMCILAFLFMLLPAVNLININVSRIMERASEIGVRKAFGASKNVLVWQFVIENVILTLIGGLFSLVLTYIILRIINNSGFISYAQLSLDFNIFIIGLIVTLFFGVLSGIYPAWKMARMSPVDALKENE